MRSRIIREEGIIKMRESYLEWLKSDKGEKDLEVYKEQDGAAKVHEDYHSARCYSWMWCVTGSSRLAHKLTHFQENCRCCHTRPYLWIRTHTQSDNVQAKGPAPVIH